MPDEIKYFPNIPVLHWNRLRIQFKKSIPGTISSNYLATVLDMTETSAKANILPSLKQVGLVDTEGKTNQELAKKFRDDDQYAKFCEDIIKKVYPQELRDAFPDKELNREKVKKWFMNHTNNGDSAAGRIAAFFVALVQADSRPVAPGTSSAKSKPAAKKPTAKPVVSKKIDSSSTIETQEKSKGNKNGSGPDLNINIQIHISSDASSDQIKSIFENMAKYIYKD
jgi:hypothetical protein